MTIECCQGYDESVVPYFFNQMPWLLFISLLLLCGFYLRAVFISLESVETSTMAG